MATVRIYKIAELLNMSSQDVVTLLRKESGIEVKSASSTIEEVVAASFVERQARQRKITLPGKSQWFLDAPAAKPTAKKGGMAAKGKAPEPPPPPAPTMRPRLVKTAKPAAAPVDEHAADAYHEHAHETHEHVEPEPHEAPLPAAAATTLDMPPAVETREEIQHPEPVHEPVHVEPEPEAPAPVAAASPLSLIHI